MKFKVGDRVRGTSDRYCITNKDWEGVVFNTREDDPYTYYGLDDIRIQGGQGGTIYSVESRFFELVSDEKSDKIITTNTTNKNHMLKKLSVFMKLFLDADTQTLKKADFINGDLELTSEGKNALFALFLKNNKADLVKMAQEVIDEQVKETE